MSNSQSILPPTSFTEVLAQIATLSDAGFEALRTAIHGPYAFDVQKERCEYLSKKAGLTAEGVAYLLSALSFLYSRIKSIGFSETQNLIVQLIDDDFADTLADESSKGLLTERLAELVRQNDNVDSARKIARLRAGFLKTATGFGSFVDARPDFDIENSQIRGFVPTVQFRVTTDADNSSDREFVFQVDRTGLKMLREAAENAEKKIPILSTASALSAPLYDKMWNSEDE